MSVLSTIDPFLQKIIVPFLSQQNFSGWFSAEQINQIMQISNLNKDALCLALLPLAAAYAITPFSHFNVGAIACGISGNLYFGANIECLGGSMQNTLHAEQSAIIHAWLRGEKRIQTLTVSYVPCGYCRQFLNELNSSTDLKLCIFKHPSAMLSDYFPNGFGPHDLNVQHLLFDDIDYQFTPIGWVDHEYQLDDQQRLCFPTFDDPLVTEVIHNSRQSYAPYSQSHSAIVLQTQNNLLFSGRYAENAAFNPSLQPLLVALNLLNFSNTTTSSSYYDQKITCAILAERWDAPLTQWTDTLKILIQLGCHKIYHLIITC